MTTGRSELPFLSLGIGWVALSATIASSMTMSPVAAAQLEATYTDLGLIGAARALPYIFLPLALGFLLHRLNKSRLLAASAVLAAISSLTIAFADSVALIVLSQGLLGLAMVAFWPVSEVLVSDWYSGPDRIRAYAKFSTALSLGFLLGSLYGGALTDAFGLRIMFIFSAAVSTSAIPFVLRLRTPPPTVVVEPRLSLRLAATLLPAYAAILPFCAILASILSIFPGHAWRLGLSEISIGLLLTLFYLFRLLSSVYLIFRPTARIVRAILLTGLLYSGPLALMAAWPGLPVMALMVVIVGLSTNIFFAVSFLMVAGLAGGNRGVGIGAYESIIGLGFFIGPPISGWLADLLGTQPLYLVLATASLASGLGPVVMRRAIPGFPRISGSLDGDHP